MKRTFAVSVPVLLALLFIFPAFIWAGGQQEAASADRGKYVVEQGRIIAPDEIHIDSYISQINYQYPDPSGDLGVTLYTGHKQISTAGQEEVIQIGIQGKRQEFEDLVPMNLAFVFDKSGSMSDKHKMEWVKQAFDLFIGRLRDKDMLSVVAFSDTAELLLPATVVAQIRDRKQLTDMVHAVLPEGKSDLKAGLIAGYDQVLSHYQPGYVNRVLFISDGLGESAGILDAVQRYKRKGISVSTIGVGMGVDLNLLIEISKNGGGSSRFISSQEKMNEIFNTDLDRMVVPVAYDLNMMLELSPGVEILETWGYSHRITGRRIHYSLSALHHRDYETILARIQIPPGRVLGPKTIAAFSVTYTDRAGKQHRQGPFQFEMQYADSGIFSSGFSDPMVLKAGTMLHIAQGLKDIGILYYSCQSDSSQLWTLSERLWQTRHVLQRTFLDEVVQLESEELKKSIQARKQRCLDISLAVKKEIQNTRARLDYKGFQDELMIFGAYLKIIGKELGLGDDVIAKLQQEEEIRPPARSTSARAQISDLIRELALALESKQSGTVVFSGFIQTEGADSSLKRLIDDMTASELKSMRRFRMIRSELLENELEKQQRAPRDSMDTKAALQIAARLEADYILTGSIIEMPQSVILFGRILSVQTQAVESVAQLILPKQGEIEKLLLPAAGQAPGREP